MTVFEKQTSRFFKLKNIGDQVSGFITDISEPRQATKFNANPQAPRVLDFWESSDGGAPRPKMEVILTLQTELREDGDDDGKRKVVVPVFYKDGSMMSAIQTACFGTGATDLEIGAWLGIRFTGHDPDSQNPQNPRKLYEAAYKRPAAGGGAFAQQQAAQQAPAPQQQPGGFQQGGFTGAPAPQQQAAQQAPAWQPPAAVNPATGEVGGQAAAPSWGGQTAAGQPVQDPSLYQPPANPTPEQQQAMNHFPAANGQQPAWQPPAPAAAQPGPYQQSAQQPPAAGPAPQAAPQQLPVVEVPVQQIRDLIAQGAPDNYIAATTGASMEAISAIRNI
ncbi:hypothetical protein QEH44_gp41 [Arthrobacter phage Shambre1]|uniref:SsDNA binding protein n=1 Tax=Arthrobacter phage Shambre1 TaxID=2927284 RepID=A0A977KPP1_9CAUD|nr:hypothetical protein QEH44_gp41 [Arthrobacter phage Shambre1]UXE04777.1 hypothetical protein SEA_SHAMBRE1_41 [Arthrobacter phage Shambre1]